MSNSIKYLRDLEWSMGCGGDENKGQCPECCGVSYAWRFESGCGHGTVYGHKYDCKLALALMYDGEDVLFETECEEDSWLVGMFSRLDKYEYERIAELIFNAF